MAFVALIDEGKLSIATFASFTDLNIPYITLALAISGPKGYVYVLFLSKALLLTKSFAAFIPSVVVILIV